MMMYGQVMLDYGGRGCKQLRNQRITQQIRYQNEYRYDNMDRNIADTFSKTGITDIDPQFVTRQRRHSRDRVRSFLMSPFANVLQLQEISRFLMLTSGNYFRIVKYLSGMSRFDYTLIPTDESVSVEDYQKAAEEIRGLRIKNNFPWIMEELIKLGEVYLYEVPMKDGLIYLQIPNEWCRVASIDSHGVLRYDVNAADLTEEDVAFMPPEFQSAVNKAASEDDGWVRIGEQGFCFNLMGAKPKGVPYFAFMFDDIMGLEDTKDLIENKTKLDTVKLIHQRIPLNDKDKPVFNMKTAMIYHEATKRGLPPGVAITTNPLEMSHVPFDKAKNQETDAIERSERNLWNSAGISDLIFSANKSGGDIMAMSITADEMLIHPIVKMFEAYVNSRIDTNKFMVKILDTTHFNLRTKEAIHGNAVSRGASRTMYLAVLGYEPHEIINTLKFEQNVLDIDSLMVPKRDSHTLSDEDEGGRPSNKEIVDEGEAGADNADTSDDDSEGDE